MKDYIRKEPYNLLYNSLHGEPNFIQVIIGPRQVGKTTLVLQLYDRWQGPKLYETADLPNIPTINWIIEKWKQARDLSRKTKKVTLLILDEAQKIPRWSEITKKLFDEDKRMKTPIRIVLLGSSSLLMQKGLTESLSGRFELHRHYHWSYKECKEYFKLTPDEYIYFGGYPGGLQLISDEMRWNKYIRDSLIETVISKDVILMSPITKPALLRQVFGLCIEHPAEIVSYQKMLGQLQDAGNTTTIAFYLRLLASAFMLAPLEKFSGSKIKQKSSSPKILVLDNSIISSSKNSRFNTVVKDRSLWGRFVENIIGAKLYPVVQESGGALFYWRDRTDEVDYIVQSSGKLIAIEVKSGIPSKIPASLNLFTHRYKKTNKIVITGSERENKGTVEEKDVKWITLESFLLNPKQIIE